MYDLVYGFFVGFDVNEFFVNVEFEFVKGGGIFFIWVFFGGDFDFFCWKWYWIVYFDVGFFCYLFDLVGDFVEGFYVGVC